MGFSRGQRHPPRRVDWDFRSGANAFPNTYDVADPTHPNVTPTANYYDAAAYPFRCARFRNHLEREDVVTVEASAASSARRTLRRWASPTTTTIGAPAGTTSSWRTSAFISS
jgi:hypothetical protein